MLSKKLVFDIDTTFRFPKIALFCEFLATCLLFQDVLKIQWNEAMSWLNLTRKEKNGIGKKNLNNP